jgi:hypothetical protein
VNDSPGLYAIGEALHRFFGGPLLLAFAGATVAVIYYANWRKRQPPR